MTVPDDHWPLSSEARAALLGALTQPFSDTTPARLPSDTTAHVVLRPLPASGAAHGQAIAYMTGGEHMLVRISGLPRSATGTYYELWLMTSPTRLVSVTSFRIGRTGSGTLHLLLPDNPAHYRYLDISVQHLGAGNAISTHSVLRGAIPA